MEARTVERRLDARAEHERRDLHATQPRRQLRGFGENLIGSADGLDVGQGELRAHPRLAALVRELERLVRPALDELHVQADRPHRGADRRLECEVRERVRPLPVVERPFERLEERRPHPLAVVAERLRLPDRSP